MQALLTKLNYKAHPAAVVVRPPPSFAPAVAALARTATVHAALGRGARASFAIAFATRQREVDAVARTLAPRLEGDAILWIAYPKSTSKRFTCDFNRDTGWAALGGAGFEPVRQIAIDEDWSALRFRRVEYIKTLTRRTALTEQGRARTSGGQPAPPRRGPAAPRRGPAPPRR